MAKKGAKHTTYDAEFKAEAVRLYLEGKLSLRNVAKTIGLKSKTQLINWIRLYEQGRLFEDLRGKTSSTRKGRPKTQFKSVEEELAYVKAERDYLKKQYPNLHREVCQKK